MSLFLKQFSTHSEYEQYINGSGAILPNVSICTTERDTHYNPIETRVVAKFNVTSTSNPTQLCDKVSQFNGIEIDGVEQPSVVSRYTFSTTGEHTVKYTLTNPTSIGEYAFRSCSSLTSIDIPNSVTSIGEGVSYNCTGLTSVTIPNSVTSIGYNAFYNCRSLTSIVSKAITAPIIKNNTFQDIKTGGTLTVPSGSSGYNVWMGTGYYYLGKYNWTKVEQ